MKVTYEQRFQLICAVAAGTAANQTFSTFPPSEITPIIIGQVESIIAFLEEEDLKEVRNRA